MHLPDIRCAYLPYCLKQTKPGWYAILHREYKPLGQLTGKLGDYAQQAVRIKGLGPATARRLSVHGDPDQTAIYLYDDGSIPTRSAWNWEAYSRRLNILAKLRIQSDDC
jgi:hypothetical protein